MTVWLVALALLTALACAVAGWLLVCWEEIAAGYRTIFHRKEPAPTAGGPTGGETPGVPRKEL